jgi:hypothetical protein
MAQTTTAVSGIDCLIEIAAVLDDPEDMTWVNISGSANAIEPQPQSRQTGTMHTLDGRKAIVKSGKLEAMDIEVKILFTSSSDEAFQTVLGFWEDDTEVQVRWSPQGGAPGDLRYTCDPAPISEFQYPRGISNDPTPVPSMFKVLTPGVTEDVIPPP